jgi:hypothetical protein
MQLKHLRYNYATFDVRPRCVRPFGGSFVRLQLALRGEEERSWRMAKTAVTAQAKCATKYTIVYLPLYTNKEEMRTCITHGLQDESNLQFGVISAARVRGLPHAYFGTRDNVEQKCYFMCVLDDVATLT